MAAIESLAAEGAQAITAAVMAGALAQILAERLRTPPILFWLLAGFALGPFGLAWIPIEAIEPVLPTLVELGLAVILFEGGLNLRLRLLRTQGGVVGRLVLLGLPLALLIAAWGAQRIAGLSWELALVFGALVAVTGPTVIAPLLRSVRVGARLAVVLEAEAVLADAFGAILAIVLFDAMMQGNASGKLVLAHIATKAAVGALLGFLGGKGLAAIWRTHALRDPDLRAVFVLGWVWMLFAVADAFSSQAGLLAVLIAGAVLQEDDLPGLQRLRRFKGALSVLLISMLFVLLAATIDLSLAASMLGKGAAVFAVLAFVARPLAVMISTIHSDLSWNERLYLAGMAPKGVVAAGMASLLAMLWQAAGHEGGHAMEALVFIVIVLSSAFYSLIARPWKRLLGVGKESERVCLLVGAGPLGAEIARALEDRTIRFVEPDERVASQLKEAGFSVVCGDPLDPLYLEIAHAEEAEEALVLTASSENNLLIARLLRDRFLVPEIYLALEEGAERRHEKLLKEMRIHRLFAKPFTYTYWNDQAWRKRLVFETRTIAQDSPLIGIRMREARIPHGVQPVAILRGGKILIPHDDLVFAAGDEVRLLLRPERIRPGEPLILPPPKDPSGVFAARSTS